MNSTSTLVPFVQAALRDHNYNAIVSESDGHEGVPYGLKGDGITLVEPHLAEGIAHAAMRQNASRILLTPAIRTVSNDGVTVICERVAFE